MHTILQKRIEEAAREYSDHNYIDECVEVPAFLEGGMFALQNQWIPVEEALPEYGEIVLVHIDGESGVGEMFSERIKNPFLIMTDENDFKLDSCKDNITHWMAIPQLKGDEK